MFKKILKYSSYFFIVIILLLIGFYFAIQYSSVQTYLTQKVGDYLSKELNAEVRVGRVNIAFIKSAVLEDVYIQDKNHDTLLYAGKIDLDISKFEFKKKNLEVGTLTLSDTKFYLKQLKNSKETNLDFLVNYFSSPSTTVDTVPSKWKVQFNKLKLNEIAFAYKDLNTEGMQVKGMNFSDLLVNHVNADISIIRFQKDSVFAQINHLSAREKSGANIKDLSAQLKISSSEIRAKELRLETDSSLILGSLAFRQSKYGDFSDFVNKVIINSSLDKGSSLHSSDIAYYASALDGINTKVNLSGNISGTVNNLTAKKLYLSYGDKTLLRSDIKITNVTEPSKMFIDAKVEKLYADYADLMKLKIPIKDSLQHLPLPEDLKKLGYVSYTGVFKGNYNNFKANGNIGSNMGTLNANVSYQDDDSTKLARYSGVIKTTDFDLNSLLGPKVKASKINAEIQVSAEGFDRKDLNARFKGIINTVEFNDYVYHNFNVDGIFKKNIFDGNFVLNDPNAQMNFNGIADFHETYPYLNFKSNIKKIDLNALHFVNAKKPQVISANIDVKIHGNDLDNMIGTLFLSDLAFTDGDKSYKLPHLNVTSTDINHVRDLKINSEILDLEAIGDFKPSHIPNVFYQVLAFNIPEVNNIYNHPKDLYHDSFKYDLTIKKLGLVSEIFIPKLVVTEGSNIHGNFNASNNSITMNGNFNEISFTGLKFKAVKIEGISSEENIGLTIKVDKFALTDSITLTNFNVATTTKNNQSNFKLFWDNKTQPKVTGDIAGNFKYKYPMALHFDKMNLSIRDSIWRLQPNNEILFDTTGIHLGKLALASNGQYIIVEGDLAEKTETPLSINLVDFKLNQFNALLAPSGFALNGKMNGSATINNIFSKPVVSTSLDFENFKVNKEFFPVGEVTSFFDVDKNELSINGFFSKGNRDEQGAYVNNIAFNGTYLPSLKTNSLNVSGELNSINLNLIQPFVTGIITIPFGDINGKFAIGGTPDKIET